MYLSSSFSLRLPDERPLHRLALGRGLDHASGEGRTLLVQSSVHCFHPRRRPSVHCPVQGRSDRLSVRSGLLLAHEEGPRLVVAHSFLDATACFGIWLPQLPRYAARPRPLKRANGAVPVQLGLLGPEPLDVALGVHLELG